MEREMPDNAMSGPMRDNKHPALLFPEASASTHLFLMLKWIDSLVVGGAKSSILRDEAIPSFLEEMLPEEKPEGRDDKRWCDAMKMVQGTEPGSGFTQEEWNRGVKHLAGGIFRVGSLEEMIEEARRLEPLKGFEESEWRMFLRMAAIDLRRASRWWEGREKCSEERRGLLPSMMETMRKVEMSLELPQQPGELAEEEERRWKAVNRLRNLPPTRDDAATLTLSTPSYYGWE
jgi:hypothetical protein